MIVIKATLREETRRLSFDSHGFPPYDEVQQKLRAIFSLPSSAHPFWVNVLFFPDDAQPARIKFKQHVCDQAEYELAQEPFLRYRGFPAPALVFTVLLSSDVRMNPIHDFHRAITLQVETRELENEIRTLEDDLTRRHQILISLEDKLDKARYDNDTTTANYWADKVEQKRDGLPELEEKLRGSRCRYRASAEELGRIRPTSAGLSFREWSDAQEVDDVSRMAETESELVAWQFGGDSGNGSMAPPVFPPLDEVLGGTPQSRNPWHAPSHWANNNTSAWAQSAPPPSFPRPAPPPNATGTGPRSFRDLFNNPELTGAPAREIGLLLDRFLNHFQGQLADTLDGFAQRIAPHPSEELPIRPSGSMPDVHIPGAFTQPEVTQSLDAQVQTAEKEKTKPSSSLGKGGYRHKHITCDGCLTGIRGTRYKCEQCSDYDLCGSCLPFLYTDALHPSSHTFKAMVHPGLEERIKFGGSTSSRAPHQSSRHPATCDICNEVIVGVRFKCLNCPDWDCCSACSKLIPNVHPDHSFVKLHKSTDYVMNAAWDAKNDVHHPYVVCDGCNLTIRGPRFKCMHPDCPDYDLCVKCEVAPVPVHPESHPMLKTKTPLRINSKSSFDPIKNVYEDHCRYRVTRDCKQACTARAPAQPEVQPQPAVPVPESKPKLATPPTASGFGGSYAPKPMPGKSFTRGEDYAKAVEAILKSMSAVSISDIAASAKDDAASSPDSATTPKPVDTSSIPTKSPRNVPSGFEAPPTRPNIFYMAPALVPSKEEPLVDLDSPITTSAVAPATFPGCSLPRLRREFDLNAEVKKTTETEKAKVDAKEEREKNNEVKKPKKIIIHTKEGPTVVTKDEEAPRTEKEKTTEKGDVKEGSRDPIAVIIESVAANPVSPEDPIFIAPALRRPVTPEFESEPADPLDILTWVRHSTILPGTTLPAGTEFTKTWQLYNYADGSEFGFKNLRLVHKSEGLLGDACKVHVVVHPEDIVKNANMNVTIEGLKVPHMPGRQILEHWRFEDDDGNAYGQPLRIRLNVEERQSSGESTASSSFIVPRAPLEAAGDSFYLPTPTEGRPVPTSDELSERLGSVAPSTAGHDDDASSTFSFSDVEHVTHGSAARTASTDDFTADDYEFVDETDEETEDGF
ncbi:hypothetical protein CspHIS471_0701450 [Cutaneotrichosporon sp. HIS471]|nr:hypothetical protein CspHIS471_0701450 [Cutaneotrichosporon sp. HIS471]